MIYNVTDEMKKAMTGLLDPTFKEVRIGVAQVRDTFKVPKFGTIAGCVVTEGRITRAGDTQARLLRDNVVVYEGKIGSLRRFKDDVSEVKSGFECGIGFEKFNDIKVGDVIEVFAMERVAITAGLDVPRLPSRARGRSDPRRAGLAAHARRARSRHRVRDADPRPGHPRSAAGARVLHGARRREEPPRRERALARADRFCAARSAPACG